jgi:hypothetical protein
MGVLTIAGGIILAAVIILMFGFVCSLLAEEPGIGIPLAVVFLILLGFMFL